MSNTSTPQKPSLSLKRKQDTPPTSEPSPKKPRLRVLDVPLLVEKLKPLEACIDSDLQPIKHQVDRLIDEQNKRRREEIEKLEKIQEETEKKIKEMTDKWRMTSEYECTVCNSIFPKALHDHLTSFPCHANDKLCYRCFDQLWSYPKYEDVTDRLLCAKCPQCRRVYTKTIAMATEKLPSNVRAIPTVTTNQDDLLENAQGDFSNMTNDDAVGW